MNNIQPKVIQKAVIQRDEKYLILLRSKLESMYAGYWDFPGWGLRNDENPIDWIQREIIEETSLENDIWEVLGIYELDLLKKWYPTHKFVIYKAVPLSDSVQISKEHDEYRRATKSEILSLPVNPFITEFFN